MEMAKSNENLECVICNENLLDPRALPCGHSYCGPPRSCLNSIKNADGGMCCAVCRTDHCLQPNDIKPLYGIRDYIHESVRKKMTKTIFLPCFVHKNKECTFWCNTCRTMICDECFDDKHEDHSTRRLKKHLIKTIEEKFGKSLKEGISLYRDDLHYKFQSQNSELERLKLRVAEMELGISVIQKQIEVLDDYSEISSGGFDDTGYESFLLFSLSKLDLAHVESTHHADRSQEANSMKYRIERGSQTLEKNEKVSKSTQSVDETMKNTKSTQSEISEFCLSSGATCNEVLPNSSVSDEGALNVSSPVENMATSSGACLFSASELVETSSGRLQNCPCSGEHKLDPPLNGPFTLLAQLDVEQRNPLRIRNSDSLIIYPYQFCISVELLKHIFQRNESILRFDVNCRHVEIEMDELLPAAAFQYVLTLQNNKHERSRRKEGLWEYPQHKQLFWYTVTYSEFLNPFNGWIDDEDNVITFALELKL